MLYLTEDDVRQLLTMDLALAAVEQGLRKLALDEAENVPRQRCQTDHVMLHLLAGSAKSVGVLGYKAYTTSRQGARFHVCLFDGRSGAILAWVQADTLGQVRTGAASGVATRYLALPDAATVGVFGAGKQARTQLRAVCAVRAVKRAVVYSPTAATREAFAKEMSDVCKTEVVPVDRPELAARGQDVVITATTSREPVLHGDWVSEGAHLNVVGSNFVGKAEVDHATLRRAALLAVDSKDQARQEAGDLVSAAEAGAIRWADVHELGAILTGRFPGRRGPQEVTLFKSIGIGLEDVVVAAQVYERARAAGVGKEVEL